MPGGGGVCGEAPKCETSRCIWAGVGWGAESVGRKEMRQIHVPKQRSWNSAFKPMESPWGILFEFEKYIFFLFFFWLHRAA